MIEQQKEYESESEEDLSEKQEYEDSQEGVNDWSSRDYEED